jgi:hypothetical protein
VTTLQVSTKRRSLVDNADLLIAAVVVVEIAMALNHLLAMVLLRKRW